MHSAPKNIRGHEAYSKKDSLVESSGTDCWSMSPSNVTFKYSQKIKLKVTGCPSWKKNRSLAKNHWLAYDQYCSFCQKYLHRLYTQQRKSFQSDSMTKRQKLARIMQLLSPIYSCLMYSTMNGPDIDRGQQAQNLCHCGDYLVLAEMGEAYSPRIIIRS